MKLNLFVFLINSLASTMILRIVNAAPVNRFETTTELKAISNSADTSKANISMVNKEFDDDLHVAENRQRQVKGIKMFNKPIPHGSTLDMKSKQISLKRSYNNKIRNIQIPIPKAGKIQPKAGGNAGNIQKIVNILAIPTVALKGNEELTISIPRFKTDVMGNWVYNPFGVTFGDQFRDTRFNFGGTLTAPRMYVESKIPKNYYPNKEMLSTVCIERSSPYNDPPIMKWLNVYMYGKVRNLKFMKDLRRNLYDEGRPIECHTSEYATFLSYINCAIFRHQRMEYLIPYYPRIQNIPANFEK